MKYVPALHWEEKSNWYLKKRTPRQKLYDNQLKKMVRRQLDIYQPDRLLDVGCGPGLRLFPEYKKAGIVDATGIDFSKGMITRAINTAIMLNLNIHLRSMGASCMEFADNWFDMVICSNVLQHIRPELIKCSIGEIIRVCKGYVVVIDYVEKKQSELSDFCFLYDYPKLFGKMELVENRRVWFEKQRLFIFEKMKDE